jgi:O-antigen/teichoic acid export membrane protein
MSITIAPLKTRRRLTWLGKPFGYTIFGPLATIAGAGTTVAAPILLDPGAFAQFALLMSILQYVADFDLGLSRLMDRTFSSQNPNQADTLRSFMLARLCVAACVSAVVLIASLNSGPLTAVAGITGVAVMLSFGPVAFYRATSNTYALTLTSLLLQAGLSFPRFAGLWTGGVSGCLVAMGAWYLMAAIVTNAPFFGILRQRRPRPNGMQPVPGLLKASLPLCAFSSLWLLYLLSSRWFSWLMSNPTDAGLFAFGANTLSVGIGIIVVVAPAYYPRHLASNNRAPLSRELTRLLAVLIIGVLVGELYCRFGLGLLFPQFRSAASSTAIMLVSGVPLGICAWLIPLVIARSRRPWSEGIVMFGVSLIGLFVLMHIGARAGIVGEAWACLPSVILLLSMLLYLTAQAQLLARKQAMDVWLGMVTAVAVSGVVWYVAFV